MGNFLDEDMLAEDAKTASAAARDGQVDAAKDGAKAPAGGDEGISSKQRAKGKDELTTRLKEQVLTSRIHEFLSQVR